jgi:MFS family permease
LPIIQDELALTYTQAGIVTSAAIITMTSSHLVVGYMGDRGWRDVFIPASVILGALVILVSSFATTFLFLTVSMLLLGAGASGYHPSVFPALTESFPKSDRAKATGIQAIGGLVGMALIPFIGVSLLVLLGGWRESFIFVALVGFALFIPITLIMRYATNRQKILQTERDEDDGEEGWTRNFALLIVLTSFRGMFFRSATLLMPLYLVESTYAFDPVLAGTFTTIMLIAGLIGEIVAAPLSDRMGRRLPFLIISTVVTTPLVLLINASLSQALLLIVLIGIGFFFFLGVPPNTAFQTEVTPRQSQGLAFGLLFSIGAIPGALSPIIFGAIGDSFGLPMSIVYLAITTALATVVSLLLTEKTQKKSQVTLSLDPVHVPE